ncbi:hypothetical protein GCU60_10205 [Blastococcus saxobsidens]|uniref:DUF4089 domain-containing protein n=1 Tax=Blastococcus saxobsidens TaxID=138336 RepID=A0A6L9W2B4_9ACTN|nr:hypothetical protein [Blastococcus saxobsidens]NEK86128.1 hypothetical protein [Blastococcus saxobsidens]
MTPTPRSFSAEAIALAAAGARLGLPEDRQEMLGAFLGEMYGLIDRLDDVPLGETPPATAFDARWEV